MARVNKTEANLEKVITRLDNASSELWNVVEELGRMKNVEEVHEKFDRLDIGLIDDVRHDLERLLEEKRCEK